MKKYEILVIETLQKKVMVEASSSEEAKQKVKDLYYDEEIVLSENDFLEVIFEVVD
jgi:hypothetical protein|uniref:DpnD/PcfM-like protein n=1 Tax=Podoviridae sp. ctz6O13 TaxID=2827757 RepID=A0A8S5TKU5_9CAUD|nr:MAG TPA: DpnD/PcfM-like protein [Podoviridae sp. ctz6O13]